MIKEPREELYDEQIVRTKVGFTVNNNAQIIESCKVLVVDDEHHRSWSSISTRDTDVSVANQVAAWPRRAFRKIRCYFENVVVVVVVAYLGEDAYRVGSIEDCENIMKRSC